MASCSVSKAPEVCAQESSFNRLPDDLIMHLVLKALETSIKDAADWPQTCVEAHHLLRFRLVCKRLAGLVPQLPCTILWSLEWPSGPDTETLVQKFLEQSERATRGLGLSLARFQSSIVRIRNDVSPDFLREVLKLTPNLELLFMKGPWFGWGDGLAARTEQFFSSISCCRKFSNLHLQVDAIDLTCRLGERFDSLRRIHLWAQDQKIKSEWILSDEGLANLIESCPRLEALSIKAYQLVEGLKSPVLRSSSLAVLHLINLFIKEKLTVDAPLLSNLFLPIVSDASVRTGRAPVALVFPNGNCKRLQLSNPSAVSNIIFTGAWTHERLFLLLRQCWNAAKLEFRGSFKVEGKDLEIMEILYSHRCALEEIRFEGGSLASFALAASEKSFGDAKWKSKLRLAVVLICNDEHDLLLCSALVKAAPHLQHLELKI